jgi:hypothetical protein
MRGTWQGSGTWQSSGLDVAGVVQAVAVCAGAAVVAGVVLEFIWWIAAFLGVTFAGLVLAGVAVRRRFRVHAAALDAARAERLEAAAARPQVTPPPQLPALEQHTHNHYHYHAAPEAPARIVIPGRTEP